MTKLHRRLPWQGSWGHREQRNKSRTGQGQRAAPVLRGFGVPDKVEVPDKKN